MHELLTPTARQLDVFCKVPSEGPVEVSEIQGDRSRPTLLGHLRALEDHGLVTVVQQRPKIVEVAATPYATTLHGLLRSRPHLRDILHRSYLLVIAALATADDPVTVQGVAETTGLHRNTVGRKLRELRRRALAKESSQGYRLAPQTPQLRHLGEAFRDHLVDTLLSEHRSVYPVAAHGLRVLLEGDRSATSPGDALAPTAAFRFQMEGADVLAARPQYAFTPGGGPVGLQEAYDDAVRLSTSPRTLDAMKRFMEERGVATA